MVDIPATTYGVTYGTVETAVYGALGGAAHPTTFIRNRSVRAAVERACEPFKAKYTQLGLVTTPNERSRAFAALFLGLGAILGLGGFKLVAALWTGHYNVVFLILMAIAASAVIVAARVCGRARPRPRRAARAGRAHPANRRAAR